MKCSLCGNPIWEGSYCQKCNSSEIPVEAFHMHKLDKMDELIEAINKLTKIIEE